MFRKKEKKAKSKTRELAEAILWALVLAFIIRAEIVQAFHIPSGSMEPTLLIGDHLLVSKSSYGVKLPLSERILIPMGEPERGDVVVFHFREGKDDLIKRIIGLPGEILEIKNKVVYINGRKIDDEWGYFTDSRIFPAEAQLRDNFGPVNVPEGHYFMMGDNRDNSYDSRFWNGAQGGFISREAIVGKAVLIHWSWKAPSWGVRWNRPGTVIQ